jgi:hypothetical protein
MLHITKKIYPASGEGRQMLNRLAFSIKADTWAAFCFQAIEFALETVAIFNIINFIAALASGAIGTALTVGLWVLAALAAWSIQWQFATNIAMQVAVNNDATLSQKLGKGSASYGRAKWAIFILALSLNTVGGYIIATSKTFKADTSTIKDLERQNEAEKKRITDNYNQAIASAAAYDLQANEVRKTWSEYAKSRPNEKSYAGIQKEAAVKELMGKKSKEIADAVAQKAAETKAEEERYKHNRAQLEAASKDDVSKQKQQEWVALVGSVLFSLVLLVLVSTMCRRVAENEAKCGIRYEIQLPSNEEQSIVANAIFTVRFILNKVGHFLLYGIYWVIDFLPEKRFNFTGHGSTTIKKEKLENKVVKAEIEKDEKQQNTIQQPPANYAPVMQDDDEEEEVLPAPIYDAKKVPFEVYFGEANPYPMTGGVSENRRTVRTVITEGNAANSANTNSLQTANNQGAQTANSANGFYQRLSGESPRKKAADTGGKRIAKSGVVLECDGKEYTLKTLEDSMRVWKTRSEDTSTRPAARDHNKMKYENALKAIKEHYKNEAKQGN